MASEALATQGTKSSASAIVLTMWDKRVPVAMRKDLNHSWNHSVEKWKKIEIYFYVCSNKFNMTWLNTREILLNGACPMIPFNE